MKPIFYIGVLGSILFEVANVYFIMPLLGSQELGATLGLAYFLYQWRWIFRCAFGLLAILGLKSAFQAQNKVGKYISIALILIYIAIAYTTNFQMAADVMFLQTQKLQFKAARESEIDTSKIIIGVEYKGEAKAYPIQFLGYHHQVVDKIANKPIIVTYCTVCRTGRVFEPLVNGKPATFRLVGMTQYNAMFEDTDTQTWWQQATGEAVAGELKGAFLPEFESRQMSLGKWLALYPNSLVMLPDITFKEKYDSLSNYESGKRKGKLTRRDTLPWQEKSWVVGIRIGKASKVYDWIQLEKEGIIYDVIDEVNKPIVLVLAGDKKTFVAFERESVAQKFTFRNDSLFSGQNSYDLNGISMNPSAPPLPKISAYQEYWHSWRTFHPNTQKYK